MTELHLPIPLRGLPAVCTRVCPEQVIAGFPTLRCVGLHHRLAGQQLACHPPVALSEIATEVQTLELALKVLPRLRMTVREASLHPVMQVRDHQGDRDSIGDRHGQLDPTHPGLRRCTRRGASAIERTRATVGCPVHLLSDWSTPWQRCTTTTVRIGSASSSG